MKKNEKKIKILKLVSYNVTFSWPVQKDNNCVYLWNIESGSIDHNEKVGTYFKDIISIASFRTIIIGI